DRRFPVWGPAASRGREMVQPSDIHPHMEVVGSDGDHVGKVDHLVGDEIELSKLDLTAGLKHHMIPLTWVDRIEDDKVCLNLTKDAAKSSWREKT
ncbi:MAG: DUF2171 domain-containing protein, partial [Phenylobacterium sp.]|nr:DUF2171 domain-containing protein [Phenylobacterium sp.]